MKTSRQVRALPAHLLDANPGGVVLAGDTIEVDRGDEERLPAGIVQDSLNVSP